MIKVLNVSFSYKSKYQVVEALKNVSCTFEKGKMYAKIKGQTNLVVVEKKGT